MYSVTVITDSREHEGFELPIKSIPHLHVHLRRSKTPTLIKIASEVDTLDAGDYAIRGFESVACVETKRAAREVHENLQTEDYRRTTNALRRLSNVRHPLLLCEFPQRDLSQFPGLVDAFTYAALVHGLSVWFAGSRSAASARVMTATYALLWLIHGVELEYPNFFHGSLKDE